MKRFHVHVAVDNLEANIRFYSAMFGAQPSVVKPDYAKWMLDDPRVNFAISMRGETPGVNHLGIQAENDEELKVIRRQLANAEAPIKEETAAACCYAESDKYWITDPQGIAWESFHTLGAIPTFNAPTSAANASDACCAPKSVAVNQGRKAISIPVKAATEGKCC